MGHYGSAYVRVYLGGFTAQEFQFGDFILDQAQYRLQRGERLLRLEKLPMELLILLVERRGGLVSREEIAERLWGKDVFLDVDHGINTAIRKVRQALRDDPDKPRFVETVVGRGYRFAAPVICSNGNSNGNGRSNLQAQPLPSPTHADFGPAVLSPAVQSPAVLHNEKRSVSVRLRLWLGGVALLALLAVAGVLIRSRSGDVTPPKITSLAVLPLKNLSGDPAQEYLADGMTEEVIGRLSMIRGLRVISRTSAMRMKDTTMSTPEIARTLHVDAIVEGSVIRDGSRVRVHAQLIRGATDEHFWSETYDREMRDALALESDVAQTIARKVETTVTGEERQRLSAVRSVSPEVYELYLRGMSPKGEGKSGITESIGYFEDAISRDPTFAPAYVGLASAYRALGTVFMGGGPPEQTRAKVISAARKALELDPQLAEAHNILAAMDRAQWRWAEAEAEYKLALELSPNDAGAHIEYADWLMCQGRTEEAVAWDMRAREHDPLAVPGGRIAWILFHARRYDESIQELRSVLAVQPDDARTLENLGYNLIAKGQPEEAIPLLEKALAITHRTPAIVGELIGAYAHAGRRADALRLLAELKRRNQLGYVPTAAFVDAYLGLDDREQAFAWLERAYQEHSYMLQLVKVHPYFDPLRGDPRFKELVHRVGLD
jgi:TolB-like protein/DNA-binding winged helix-turn-helix (wHTH) protein/Tfp pilus assembly protein PilF